MVKTDVVRTMRERLRKGRRCMDTVQSDGYVVRVRGVRERQAGGQCTATAFRGPVGRAGISARTPSTSMGARPLNGRVSRNAGQDPTLYPHRSPSGTGRVGSTEEPSRGSSYRPSGVGAGSGAPKKASAVWGPKSGDWTHSVGGKRGGYPPFRVPASTVSSGTPREEEEALLGNLSAFDGGLSRETGVESP